MRKDQKLSEKYQKNQRFEKVITSLNNQLNQSQQELLEETTENFPTIHILGAPRSGTTLVSQLIPTYLDVAHINNFIATFWKAPIYGIELSKKLIPEKYISNFTSDYGRTSNINEPHEFGYFWNYHLKYTELHQKPKDHEKNIDWKSFSNLINNMTDSFGKPIIFKSFLLGFHAETFHENLSKTKFIYVKRNLVDNFLSIKKLREKLNGDINSWGSIKPIQYEVLKNLDVYEQIVGQILCLESEYLKQLEHIPKNDKMIIKYELLCEDPKQFLSDINKKFLDNSEFNFDTVPNLITERKNENDEEIEKINLAKNKILKLFPDLKLLKP